MTEQPSKALGVDPLVLDAEDAIFLDKGDGTSVRYYLFPEYEVHANAIQPGTVQGWHHHRLITETLFITVGAIEARWIDGKGKVQRRPLTAGSLFDVGASVHTFANTSPETAEFLVFRFVPDGVNKRELIKTDRYTDDIVEH